jgi:hypothetical protein
MTKHHHHSRPTPVEDLPPWSETREEPDAQWVPVTPCVTPLKVVQVPFYTSSEDPAPEWVTNVLLWSHRRHHHHHRFLHHRKDDVPRYVYGRNPYTDTVKTGGSHYQ